MKSIVVGGGVGGLASALLLSHHGDEVTLLEAHSELGGCASFFKRGAFTFDVGATTISGVGPEGPVGRLLQEVGAKFDFYPADPGMVIYLSSGKKVSYHKDFERWMRELEEKFPGKNHRRFWEKVRLTSQRGWELLGHVESFPFTRISDLAFLIKHPQMMGLASTLMESTSLALKRYELDFDEYREMVDGILLISAQVTSEYSPFIVGSMALTYPSETYAIHGGMKGLMKFFEAELLKRNVKILKRHKVVELTQTQVTTQNGVHFQGDRVILNMPIWNIDTLLNESEELTRSGHWGAFTLYFGVKECSRELYHQVHLNHPLVKNYFVSFSIPNDQERAPEGYQTVSISTHVDATEWEDIDDVKYQERKQELTNLILNHFKAHFKIDEVKFLTSGTPQTFEDYTHRRSGYVGGLPFLFGKNPFRMLNARTSKKHVYRVGDTIFPGQGICGVVAGAFGMLKELRKDSHI